MRGYGGKVRWDQLFADLEAQADALDRAALEGDAAERQRLEQGRLQVASRLAAHVGRVVTLHLVQGEALAGEVREVGADWVLLDRRAAAAPQWVPQSVPQSVLVGVAAIDAVAGLTRASLAGDDPGSPDGGPLLRLPIGVVLRGLARDRALVAVRLRSGSTLTGTIGRVGVDHLDLAMRQPGEASRRPGWSTDVRTVLTRAVVWLSVTGSGELG